MVMVKLMKVPGQWEVVKDKAVHEVFHQRPGQQAHHHQIEARQAGKARERQDCQRDRDEIAEVSDPLPPMGGPVHQDDGSLHGFNLAGARTYPPL